MNNDIEKGTIKITADSTEIILSYQLNPETLNRIFNLLDRFTNKQSIKKLWKHFISESRRIRRKKNI